MTNHLIIAALLGFITKVFYELWQGANYLWYNANPSMQDMFYGWHLGLLISCFGVGLLCRLKALNGTVWLAGNVIAGVFFVLILTTGMIYGFNFYSDEFILYFTEVQTAGLVIVMLLGLFLRHIMQADFGVIRKLNIVSGLAFGYLFAFVFRFLGFLEISHLWIFMILAVALMVVFSRATSYQSSSGY